MELFSKRYPTSTLKRLYKDYDGHFMSFRLRNMLLEEMKFFLSSKEYIEQFLLVDDKIDSKVYLHFETLKNLSKRVLGYDLAGIIDCQKLEVISYDVYSDSDLLDFIELMIIFAKKERRDIVASRIKSILEQESDDLTINNYMIMHKKETGLRALIPIIKDVDLRKRLDSLYSNLYQKPNYEILARSSADILQKIFSSPKNQDKTKKFSESLCNDIATKWTVKSKKKNLVNLLSEFVKHAKDLNNQIANIRHTDRYTIPIEGYSFYKLIAHNNISIIELVIQSLPEKFVTKRDPDELKEQYLENYCISPTSTWTRKPKQYEEVDIPF